VEASGSKNDPGVLDSRGSLLHHGARPENLHVRVGLALATASSEARAARAAYLKDVVVDANPRAMQLWVVGLTLSVSRTDDTGAVSSPPPAALRSSSSAKRSELAGCGRRRSSVQSCAYRQLWTA
jgi:hypothetical protein